MYEFHILAAELLFACIAAVLLVAFLLAGSIAIVAYELSPWLFIIAALVATFGGIPLAYKLTVGRIR